MGAHGEVVQPLDEPAAELALRATFARGIRACAIVLMHGYRYTDARAGTGGARAAHRLHAGVGVASASVR